jgi:RimJ/RimL family protein N-acetyltransferase
MTPLDLGHLELVGRRVALRPLLAAHAPALSAAAGESRDSFGFSPVPDGLDETVAYVGEALEQRQSGFRYPFVIEWQGRVVGTTSYYDYQPWHWPPGSGRSPGGSPDSVEIGYTWLAASAQRTDCNTEAKLLLFTHAFERWRVHSVSLRTDERNLRSRRAMERLGCVFEGVRRAHLPASDGTARSSAYYSIVASEWPAAKERIERLLRRAGG